MITVLVILLTFLWLVYDRLIDGRKLPPGPTRFPIFGNIPQLSKKAKKVPGPHLMLKEFNREYGPIVTLQHGMKRQIVTDDYEIIKQVFKSDAWLDRNPDAWMLERSYNKPLGILWGTGEPWRNIRRFTIRTLRDFGFGKQKGQDAIMEEELEELFRRLDKKLEADKESSIEVNQIFNVSVLNILWSMFAGMRFSHDDDQLQEFVRQFYHSMRFLKATGNLLTAYPFLRGPLRAITGIGMERKKLVAELQEKFLGLLQERRQLGRYKEEQNDYIDVFLMESDRHQDDTSPTNVFTEQQFVTVCLDLFGAGSETTANTLEFSLLYMLLNPQVQEKVREEVDREIGRTAFPTLMMKNKMPYTEATLMEAQRYASVAPIVGRACTSYQKLGNYGIKKGTILLMNIASVHHNPEVWENPEEFRPERFLNERNEIVNADKLFIFGQGKRMCMGEVQARATLFSYFVRFIQNYTIEKSPFHPTPTTECVPGLTLAPKPYHAVIKKRP